MSFALLYAFGQSCERGGVVGPGSGFAYDRGRDVPRLASEGSARLEQHGPGHSARVDSHAVIVS